MNRKSRIWWISRFALLAWAIAHLLTMRHRGPTPELIEIRNRTKAIEAETAEIKKQADALRKQNNRL